MVEARFARVKYAMIAEVMRANGAREYQADLIEKELPRLSRLAGPYAKSGEDLPTASRPAEEKVNEITADIEAKISAQFMEQTKTLSAANHEELNETLKEIREDIKNVRVAILEKVTDLFRPAALKSDHRLENLDYQTSDRASQTARDAFCQPDMAQYQKTAHPQDELLCESPDHQPPYTPVQQLRSVKEPESTAKEEGLASAKQISPRDRNVDSAKRTSALPYEQNMDPVRQTPTSYLHSENLSQRKHPVPHERATDSAKTQNTMITCRKCHRSFDNHGSLHSHLRSGSHYGPFPPPVIGTGSTAAATEASAKPRTKGQHEINVENPGYPSLYRPHTSTGMERDPPQMDGARDIVDLEPDPAAQFLPPENLSTALVNRISHGHTCQVCHESFESKKQLCQHLKDEGHLRTRDDQRWLSMLPTGPKKPKKSNQTGPQKKSQVPRR